MREFRKLSNFKFHESPSNGSRVSPCGWMEEHDAVNCPYSQFCKHSYKSILYFGAMFSLPLFLTKHSPMQHVCLFSELLNHSSDILLCITALKYLLIYAAVPTHTYSVLSKLKTFINRQPITCSV
jgi:hypothetical protein